MGKKSGPKAPDPTQTAKAQAEMNKEAILASALANRTSSVGPSGQSYWTDASGNKIDPSTNYSSDDLAGWTQHTELGESEQAMKNLLDRQGIRKANQLKNLPFSMRNAPEVGGYSTDGFYGIPKVQRGDASPQDVFTGLEGDVPSMDSSGLRDLDKNYSQDAGRVEQATYDRLMGLINPGMDKARQREENRLAVMGHAPGGDGYGYEKDRLDRRENEARLNAGLESVGAGRAEQSRMFGIDSSIHDSQRADITNQFGADMAGRGQTLAETLSASNSANQANARDYQQMQGDHSAGMQDRANQEREMLNMFTRQDQMRDRFGNEKLQERNQAINELSAVMGNGNAISSPMAKGDANYSMASPDLIGLTNNAYNTKAQNQASKKGGLTDLAGTLGAAGMMASDEALKTNIQKAGEYKHHEWFTWEWNDKAKDFGLIGKAQGVIAQKVREYAPWLIHERDGYLAVNYGGL